MAAKREIIAELKRQKVRFLRLMFTDIMGAIKNVEVPESQFQKALDGEIMFDGSSIEGFTRIEESDMLLKPDLDTFVVFPWADERGTVAGLICDVYNPDETPFEGCPRMALRRVMAHAKKMGFTANFGPELEFFLFQRDEDGNPTTQTHDAGGYFDLLPVDRGEECRRDITNALEAMGYNVEAAHHEVAPGQHEIDFRYADVLSTADRAAVFRLVVKKYARDHQLHATFMPKPIFGENGSGMHVHQSLFRGTKNAFYAKSKEHELSDTMLHYVGGLLRHARAICAISNPLVNSYKRLVPGYEAPVNVAWSYRNRSPLVRVPARRGVGTRCELRMPDPSCNPYLAFAAMLSAGLDGIENKIDPGPSVDRNIFEMSHREKRRLKIDQLPANLHEAVTFLRKDKVLHEALGEHIADQFCDAKDAEWSQYISTVHEWELERYLAKY
jgi:glutamine synthetase